MTSTMIKHIAIGFRLTALVLLGAGAGQLAAAAVSATSADASSTSSLTSKGIDAVLGASKAKSGGDEFLPPDEAFRFDAIPDGPDHVRLIWQIADGYYLYRTRVKAATTSDKAQLGALEMPTGETKSDEYFGKQEIYHHELVAGVPVARASAAELALPLQVTYQGCATAGLCYPPITKEIMVSLPSGNGGAGAAGSMSSTVGAGTVSSTAGGSNSAASVASASALSSAGTSAGIASSAADATGYVSEQDRFATLIKSGNTFLMLGGFFLAGLVLAFTPCVLPMVPILSGIIAGQGKNVTTGRAFALSLTYVLGMAFTYTIAGALCAAAGKQVQTVFQQPWILALFAALFIVLALSMFGLFTIQMPAAIQTRVADVSNKQAAGTFGGVALMGVLSALIVTTCVGPALVGALIVIGQTGQIARGAAALFAMSIGMGTPLLVVGASAGKLLPKAGAWMDTVKKLFGVMMLAVAAWMLARIIPERLSLVLWAIPALVCAWLLLTEIRKRSAATWVVRFVGAAAGVYGLALITGSALGGTDPLSPFASRTAHQHELPFRTIKSVADLQREITLAQTEGRTVLVDFSAKWCVSCKEMEKYTFTDSAVKTALDRTVLLRADVTENDADDQALLKHMGIIGPPTIAFYGLNGQERANYRVVGFMKADEFASHAREALGG
ncbi:MAG: thiol:disulfide interchange protein DsbD [Gammaproteobacteria bacterium]|nr:thiol:disulfide interchange protein DsbD [Gammaproteobacteria bacterium]